MGRQRAILLSVLILLALAGVFPHARAFADEPNRAGLVIQSGDGQVVTRCVAFEKDEISGANLLASSGLDVIVDPASSMGIIVCQIEGVGCAHPAEACFCLCMGGGECEYWNYFYRDTGDAEWAYSALGAALRKVKPGSVDAWVWGDGHTPPADSLVFEEICAPPTPIPTETPEPLTSIPATAAPTQAQVPTQPPTASPTATDSLPTIQPIAPDSVSTPLPAAGTTQNLLSYWPFGLMVLGLALVGALVLLRRA